MKTAKRLDAITFQDLCGEEPSNDQKALLDRDDIDVLKLNEFQRQWRDNGFLAIPLFGDEEGSAVINAYCKAREERCDSPGGWSCPTPYLQVDELKDLFLHPYISAILAMLFAEPMGLHLNLTGWVSTERNWHQDDYLNPDFVNSRYCAIWIALDDIHPDSGPFEYVPGSHRWPLTRREKVWEHLSPSEQRDPAWPTKTQDWVSAAFEREIERREARVEQFIAKKGDVLFWHGRLAHRGSPPNVPGMRRKAVIGHFSALDVRTDMPHREFWQEKSIREAGKPDRVGGWYFDFPGATLT